MTDVYIMQPFDKREFAKTEILLTSKVTEILGISRARMNALLKTGQINTSIFLREGWLKDME
ncbi:MULTISPECIES: hypothetical protein [Bacillus]|uniref:DNA-binding protein n=1 Tax=Bacillus toyonensis TaxID=155322 RepID=A0A2C5IVJ3_9BACI|nr:MULTISPECIES: hypothetical protein [Bacillus]EOP27901.1 hypothetical protein IIS_00501 [Bacillus cereus VD131]OFD04873.1 hypothetical protein BTGOE5_05130 [Bacillus thuringiensis]KAF6560864.1 hypothetical protein G9F74_04495 [Bacillus sp. EKM202B]MBJ7947147.1 hypothetical protein [Bacillus cereus group sp. N24]MBJ8041103.1 hypothetical protein [Bacillus cereus group sp. N17]